MSQQRNTPGLLSMLALLTALCWSPAFAQTNDDLYYNPDREPVRKKTTTTTTTTTTTEFYGDEQYDREPGNTTRPANTDEGYADDYEDDYAYEYSSRIRRFHRPTRVIDFYDPFYVDLHFYDPFFLPGASIYTFGFDDYWSYRRFRRFQRWNNGWGWNNPWNNPWNNGWGGGFNNGWGGGWNRGWGGGWNAWNNPCVYNNYFYDPYWTWNGFNPYYASGNVWVNNGVIINNGNNGGGNNGGGGYTPRTYTGVRRGGTVVNPGYARIQDSNGGRGRLATVQAASDIEPVIELRNNNGRADAQPDGTAPVRTAPNRPTSNGRAVTEMPRANEEGVRSRDDSQPTSVRSGSEPVRTTRQPRVTDARPGSDNINTPAPERPAREPRTYERPQQREYAPQQREASPERPAREPRTYERPQQREYAPQQREASPESPAREPRTYERPQQREYTPRQREESPERSQERSNPQPQRSYERPQQREYNPPARSGGGDGGGSRGGSSGGGGGSSRSGSSGSGSTRSGSSNGRQ
jgi:hypothetical protein